MFERPAFRTIGEHVTPSPCRHVTWANMTRHRFIALLATASLAAIGCGNPWTVVVYNNDMDKSIGVRLRMPAEEHAWILEPQQLDTLVEDSARHSVTIELFDPADCAVLAREELPDGPGLLVLAHQGVTGDGPWQIDAGIETGAGGGVLEPNFDGCQ